MSSIPPAAAADDEAAAVDTTAPSRHRSTGRRQAVRRSVIVLCLAAGGLLIPLLGPGAALDGTGEADDPGVRAVTLLRAVLFAALAVPVGEEFVRRLAARVPGVRLPRSWSGYAAVVGALAALGLTAIVAAGNLVPTGPSDMDIGGLYGTRDGTLALIEVNAFVVAALTARSRSAVLRIAPLAAIIAAEALRAHPTVEDTPLLGSALTLVHLTCAALWAGGLLYALRTVRTLRAAAPDAGAAVLGRYARVATLLLAALTATGVCSTLRRMPAGTVLDQLTETAYGRTLVAKVLLVAVVCALALTARRRLRRAAEPLAAYPPARAEVILLGAVVAVSALLTAVPVPIRW
ncbi:CopD family protein [Streptomyces boninensis]|uniref:CopD family protein n=1 Tax=Streptomyces boninensis TaxID=2039455 RepID=UPI003B210EBD